MQVLLASLMRNFKGVVSCRNFIYFYLAWKFLHDKIDFYLAIQAKVIFKIELNMTCSMFRDLSTVDFKAKVNSRESSVSYFWVP